MTNDPHAWLEDVTGTEALEWVSQRNARTEARLMLRNGEQLLVTLVLPALLLVGMTRSTLVSIGTGGAARVDVLAPSVLALAVMTTAFTSQAIATAFDRRNGVLRLLARGQSNPEIAANLFVSESTVKANLTRIMAKLEVRDRVQLIIRAAQLGLVTLALD